MGSEQDRDKAIRAAQRSEWKFIGFLAAVPLVGFWAWFAYEDHQAANETCAERVERLSNEQGVPMMNDPRTGLASGCVN